VTKIKGMENLRKENCIAYNGTGHLVLGVRFTILTNQIFSPLHRTLSKASFLKPKLSTICTLISKDMKHMLAAKAKIRKPCNK
jgi:hypothetical protein